MNTKLVCELNFNAMLVVKPMESEPVVVARPGFMSAGVTEKLAAVIAAAVMVPTATS